MRKVFLTLLILAVGSPCFAKYSGGTGEPNNPYKIATAEDLNDIGNHIEDFNKCFIITADINLAQYTGRQYRIIGNSYPYFTGTFDGNEHIIRNLNCTAPYSNYVGLFGYTSNAIIKNVHLEDVNISTIADYTGGLVGYQANGSIINCSSTGSINITASSSPVSWSYTGGLVGRLTNGNITDCFSTGSVSTISSFLDSLSRAGGLVGEQINGTITNSYSTDSVKTTSSYSNYYSYAGGLVGYSSGNISNCYSAGSVTNYSPAVYAGGLMGYQSDSSSAKIEKCYSIGQVSAAGTYVHEGGLIGRSRGTVISCFWDINTSGQSVGIGSGTATGVTGETTAQMKTLSTFTSVGWDFVGETVNGPNDAWAICEGTNYPKLTWQILPGDIVCPDGVDFEDLDELCYQWLVEEIPADLAPPPSGDGIVDFADFAVFAKQWGITNSFNELLDFTGQWLKTGLAKCSADIAPLPGGDGQVNFADFAIMANNWLKGF